MKYVDEYRDGKLARADSPRRSPQAADPAAQLSLHGILRRPHPCDLALRPRRSAAGQCPDGARPRLPGLRAADRPHRHGDRAGGAAGGDAVHLRRSDAGAGLARHLAAARQGRRRRHPHGVFDAGRDRRSPQAEPEREVVFFAIGFETTTPPTALAIKLASAKRLANFTRVLQPRADAAGDPRHSRTSAISTACDGPRSTASSARRMSAR